MVRDAAQGQLPIIPDSAMAAAIGGETFFFYCRGVSISVGKTIPAGDAVFSPAFVVGSAPQCDAIR